MDKTDSKNDRKLRVGVLRWDETKAYKSIGRSVKDGLLAFEENGVELVGHKNPINIAETDTLARVVSDRLSDLILEKNVDAILVCGDRIVEVVESVISEHKDKKWVNRVRRDSGDLPIIATAASCLDEKSCVWFNFWGPTIHAVSISAALRTVKELDDAKNQKKQRSVYILDGGSEKRRPYDEEAIRAYNDVVITLTGCTPIIISFKDFLGCNKNTIISNESIVYVVGYPDDGYCDVLEKLNGWAGLTVLADSTFLDETIEQGEGGDKNGVQLWRRFPKVISYDCSLLRGNNSLDRDEDDTREVRPHYFARQSLCFLKWAWQYCDDEQFSFARAVRKISDFRTAEGEPLVISPLRHLVLPVLQVKEGLPFQEAVAMSEVPAENLGTMLKAVAERMAEVIVNPNGNENSVRMAINSAVAQLKRTLDADFVMMCDHGLLDPNSHLLCCSQSDDFKKRGLFENHDVEKDIFLAVSYLGRKVATYTKVQAIQVLFNQSDLPNNGAHRLYVKRKKDGRVVSVRHYFGKSLKSSMDRFFQDSGSLIIAPDDECARVVSGDDSEYDWIGLKFEDKEALRCIFSGLWHLIEAVEDKARAFYIIPSRIKVIDGWEDPCYAVVLSANRLSSYGVSTLSISVDKIFEPLKRRRYLRQLHSANIRSAIGSIMSRNGSHNIGSHVLAALSHNVGTMPDDRVLYQYIQNRMDYIATATTDFPRWTYTTKFVGGMIKEFLSQRHLLDYISRSEGLHAFRFQDHNNCGEGWDKQEGTIRLHVSRFGQGVPAGKSVTFLEYSDGSLASREKLIEQARGNQQFDLDIAIPGGVIGQHAFFTIIENVLRNAAKHGWATLPKECRCGVKDHLDVYVNFELEQDCRNVLVRVSDNISDVFGVPELKEETAARKFAREVCQKWCEDYRKTLSIPLSFTEFKLLREFLSGSGGIQPENLPAPYADLYRRLQQLQEVEGDGPNPVWKGIPDLLRGMVDPKKPDALGWRLWLPLHHAQQLILSEKFIDEDGSLRREHWGLAEMKISAGFLQMRSIEDIGGLNEMVNDCRWDNKDALLIPCCDPDNHLEYQFRIRCPREVAFVVRQSELKGRAVSSGTFIALQKLGVYVVVVPDGDEPGEKADEAYDRAFKSGEKESLSWDYRYVVLPKFPDLDDPQLPFRIVLGSECVPEGSRSSVINNLSKVEEKFYHRAKRDILSIDNPSEGAVSPSIFELASEIKTHVFSAWNVYWREKRRCDIDIERPLRLCLDVNHSSTGDTQSSKKSAERCLISDADVWKTVFCELFRSYARRMIQKNLSPYKQTEVKGYLALLAVADKRSYGGFDNVAPRASMMKTLYDWMVPVLNVEDEKEWNVWLDRHQAPLQEFWRSCECEWAACRKYSVDFKDREVRQRLIAFHQDIHRWIEDCASHPGLQYGVPTIVYDGRPMEYPGLSVAMACLEDVFEYVNVLLRKYEERIVTLPESFKPQKTGDGMRMKAGRVAVDHANQVGVMLELEDCSLEDTDVVRLNYIRHYACSDNDSASKMAYAEPLSGTQTYLNTLSALVNCSDASQKGANQRLVSLLYENALARILIIDERTVDFAKKHRDAAACFSRMGIWVYDHETWDKKSYNDQEKGLWHDAGHLPMKRTLLGEDEIGLAHMLLNDAPDFNKERLKVFDALIIHQGLIDKWLPTQAQSRSSMETLLANLRRHVPYVLITTGRGTPANTPNTARILPFSVIEKTLFRQSPEKLILMDTIMSVLPIGVRK